MSAPTKDPILQLIDLKKQFGEVIAVNSVSLDIGDGEFLTLLGPSGSGKTTILNMIAGFEFPTAGEVILQGQSINSLLPEKRNIGLVFQNYALFPHMNVFDNIAFPLKMRKFPKNNIQQKVESALELVQLQGYGTRVPKQLSGGQQQRIAVARALVFDAPLLLFDEPLGALDKKLREHMQLELKHIHTKLNRTMIYVTHDQEEALVMSDRIAVMNQGRIEQVGPPDELYDKPTNSFVANFIGESNFIDGTVVKQDHDGLILKLREGPAINLDWTEPVPANASIRFCLRPEKIFFADDATSQNSINGVIEEVIYVGETKRYMIRISEAETVNMREMSTRIGRGRQKGEQVKIGWFKESLRKLD
jgi:putative spermidine/putrescine transport system ATP-binding protein